MSERKSRMIEFSTDGGRTWSPVRVFERSPMWDVSGTPVQSGLDGFHYRDPEKVKR